MVASGPVLHYLPPRMEQRTLGRTGLPITALSLGTWGLAEQAYGPSTEADLDETIDAAFEVGVRGFDTAPLWGDGAAEAALGRVLGERRDVCTIVTRAGILREDGEVLRRYEPEAIRESVEASLLRLQTSYIDVLLLHEPPEKALFDGRAIKTLAGLRTEKLIRAFGMSVSTIGQARVAVALGAEVVVIPHHLLANDLLKELSDQFVNSGTGVIARSPLFHGLLADRNRLVYEADDHRSQRFPPKVLAERQRHAAVLEGLTGDDVPSLGAAALRFALTAPVISSAIVGARSPEQIRDAAAWLEGGTRLSPEALARIPTLLANVGA